MTWPTVSVDTTYLDAGTDSAASARAALFDLAGKFNQVIGHVSSFMQGVLSQTTAGAAQSALSVPSTTGSGASGTWGISITGNAATATAASGTAGFTVPRQDTVNEGGQLNLARASDNSNFWFIDVYGSTSTPTLRMIGNTTVCATLDSSGNFTATANVTAYSDVRLKKNIATIDRPLAKVKAMRGIYYSRTEGDTRRQIGLVAQEVAEVIPEAVICNEDTGYYSVAYGNLVGLLVEAVKELSDEVETLKARNDSTRLW